MTSEDTRDSPVSPGPRQLARPGLTEATLITVLIGASLWYGAGVLRILRSSHFTDLEITFRAAQAVRSGASPYDPAVLTAPFGSYYNKPPLLALMVAPATSLPFTAVAQFWMLLNQGLYTASFVLIVNGLDARLRSPTSYLVAIMFLTFQPTLDSLYGGQLDVFFLFILVTSWRAIVDKRDDWSGAGLALAAMLKIYPGFVVVFAILRRRWRALGTFAITGLGLGAFSVWLAGWEVQREFLFTILPAVSGGVAYVENQTLFGLMARLFLNGSTLDPRRVTLPAVSWLHALASVAVLVVTMAFGWWTAEATMLFANLIVVALLIAPLAWVHYEVILLLPLAILLDRQLARREGRLGWALLIPGWVLLAVGNQENVRWSPGLFQSYKVYGMVFIWVLGLKANAAARPLAAGGPSDERAGPGAVAVGPPKPTPASSRHDAPTATGGRDPRSAPVRSGAPRASGGRPARRA